MHRLFWLWVLLQSNLISKVCTGETSEIRPLKLKSFINGDLILGGFFSIHGRDNEKVCGELRDEGLIQLEAMLYAMERINNDATLLHDVKLGVIAVDSCDSVPKALEEAVEFAKGLVIRDDSKKKFKEGSNDTYPFTCGTTDVLPTFESKKFEKVVAIIGDHSSWVSKQVADLMRIYQVPQVSYQSTNPALSDIGYEYFFRTVPPLNHQMKVIVEILRSFGWKYFAVVYADSDYGNKGFEVLKRIMLKQKISLCMSSAQRINVENAKDSSYDFVVSELLKRNATAVIVFSDHEMARNLMSAVTRTQSDKHFVWIGSTAWVGQNYVVTGNENVLEGAIGIIHDSKPYNGFEQYLKSRRLESHSKKNPWFTEYWERHLNCRVENVTHTPFSKNDTEFCHADAALPSHCYKVVSPSVQFVRDAVYSVAYALDNMYSACTGNKSCLQHDSIVGKKMRKYLQEVEFEDENRNLFRFDEKGDGPVRYTVVNLQRVEETNEYRWIKVGNFDERSGSTPLVINKALLRYKPDNVDFPLSVCSTTCKKGQAKILLDEAECCWHCSNCSEYQYVEDDAWCKDCPVYALPNDMRDGCEPMVSEYMDFPNSWAVGCIVLSVIGILMTLSIGWAIGNYWDTPIIVASGREFSFILLIGIILSFSLTFAIVSKPSEASCGIVRFFMGFFYTISYASIAAKTHYLSKLYKRRLANKKPKPINTKSLILIVLTLIAVEGTINGTWLQHSPPDTDFQYPSRTHKVLICKGSDTAGYLVGLVLPFSLMLFCTVYAFRIREFSGAFNEMRYIGSANYTTVIVWLAFLAMFLLNSINSLRVVLLSLLLNSTAVVQLVCLFLPKLYLAVRRPEKNKHENIMCYDGPETVHTSI